MAGSRKRSCPKGQIRRKGSRRRSYTRADGTKVSAARVSSACTKDMGKPGKTRKSARVLPKFSGDMHLSKFGYSLDRPEPARQEALRKAVRVHGSLPTLRHLNLARNYQAVESNKRKMSKDVDYLSRLHSKTKRSKKRSRKVSRKRSRKVSRKGSKRVSRKDSRKRSKK